MQLIIGTMEDYFVNDIQNYMMESYMRRFVCSRECGVACQSPNTTLPLKKKRASHPQKYRVPRKTWLGRLRAHNKIGRLAEPGFTRDQSTGYEFGVWRFAKGKRRN